MNLSMLQLRPNVNVNQTFVWLTGATEIGLLILLTQSRGPIGTYAICLAFSFLAFPRLRPLAARMAFVLGIACLLLMLLYGLSAAVEAGIAFVDGMVTRGDSYRVELWTMTVQEILTSPLSGHGIAARLSDPVAYAPHNLFLATAYYFGVPALVLLVVALVSLAAQVARSRSADNQLAVLAGILLMHAVLSVLTDHGAFIKGPSPLWMIFWLPVAMAIATTTRLSSEST
jgi:O-Antigen ligase